MAVKIEMNKEQIEKSFNLRIIETKERISKVIGEARLPAAVTQMILREITNAIDIQVRMILDKEREDYNKKLEEAK